MYRRLAYVRCSRCTIHSRTVMRTQSTESDPIHRINRHRRTAASVFDAAGRAPGCWEATLHSRTRPARLLLLPPPPRPRQLQLQGGRVPAGTTSTSDRKKSSTRSQTTHTPAAAPRPAAAAPSSLAWQPPPQRHHGPAQHSPGQQRCRGRRGPYRRRRAALARLYADREVHSLDRGGAGGRRPPLAPVRAWGGCLTARVHMFTQLISIYK